MSFQRECIFSRNIQRIILILKKTLFHWLIPRCNCCQFEIIRDYKNQVICHSAVLGTFFYSFDCSNTYRFHATANVADSCGLYDKKRLKKKRQLCLLCKDTHDIPENSCEETLLANFAINLHPNKQTKRYLLDGNVNKAKVALSFTYNSMF